jgi:ATP-binding cassette subfamily B protein
MHGVINEIGLGKVVESAPQGIKTHLTRNFSPEGIKLSGGEDQKLVIARAVFKDTPILILDEPTSSLDLKAEEEIYNTFFTVSKDKTTIFISHRFASSQQLIGSLSLIPGTLSK